MTVRFIKRRLHCGTALRAFTAALISLPMLCTAHDVLIEREVNLRSAPNTDAAIMGVLKIGEEARLLQLEQDNDYYQVLHKTGVGWVWAKNVSIFPEFLGAEQWRFWTDADGDCQHTRQEVLIAKSETPVTFTDSSECTVASGQWTDPYSGETFTDPEDVDIDHLVPLRNAHRSGGWKWSMQRREAYANDLNNPEHLVVVKAHLVQKKLHEGPDEWLPPNEDFHCQYVEDWRKVKRRWKLAFSTAEREKIHAVRIDCAKRNPEFRRSR